MILLHLRQYIKMTYLSIIVFLTKFLDSWDVPILLIVPNDHLVIQVHDKSRANCCTTQID